MSAPLGRIGIVVIGVIAFGVIGWRATARLYLEPRAKKVESIENIRAFLAGASKDEVRQRRLEDELQAVADRTLGADREAVDHHLRQRLNRIGEAVGLTDLVVNTTPASVQMSPARRQLGGKYERALRDEPDLIEVGGSLSGRGSLEQAVAAVRAVEAEAWIKRVDQLRLDPRDNGETLTVTIRLTTLFLPTRGPMVHVDDDAPVVDLGPYAGLVAANPFRLPAPGAPEPPPVQPPVQPETPPFPFADWVITGMAEVRDSGEIWMRNTRNSARHRLEMGQIFHGLELIEVTEDVATFTFDGASFTIDVGNSLADRTPTDR